MIAYGFEDGSIRMSADLGQTWKTTWHPENKGEPIDHIVWEPARKHWWQFWVSKTKGTWRATSGADIWFSVDDGVTWAEKK